MTRQRRIIHDYLLSTKSHPTAEEIYMNVKKNMPSIAVGTVYRNLSLMTDAGEVRRITVPSIRTDTTGMSVLTTICSV